ncbi:MAG: hydrogenase 3 maturation endopeptidase HyCI [Candidatus Bathyarchaeia archaeon]|jgi:hydrogenase 3 maturation protease
MPNKTGKHNVREELSKWLGRAERLVLAGIGNPIRGDDFVGVKIVQNLKGRVSKRVFLVECETVPESYIEQIIDFNPTHILLIDAAVLGLKPGDSELREPENLMATPAFSTHMLPLRVFCEYLSKTTKATIALLLIEPENTDFGEGLSPEVDAVAKKITKTLVETFSQEN